MTVSVGNIGTANWTEPPPRRASDSGEPASRAISLVGTWESADPAVGLQAAAVELAPLDLQPGAERTFELTLTAPPSSGIWFLHLDLFDTESGSLAARGSAPTTVIVIVMAGIVDAELLTPEADHR
jgi:hypothetical protein